MSAQQQLSGMQNSGNFPSIWGSVGIILLAFLSLSWARRKNYNRRNSFQGHKFPGPGKYFLGAYCNLFRLSFKRKIYKQLEQWSFLYGPIFEVNLESITIVFLNSPKFAQKLLGNYQTDDKYIFFHEFQPEMLTRYLKLCFNNAALVHLLEEKPETLEIHLFHSPLTNRGEWKLKHFSQMIKKTIREKSWDPLLQHHPIWNLSSSMLWVKEDAFRVGELLAKECTLNSENKSLNDDTNEVLIHLITSGYESTATTLKLLLFLLALNPNHQELCYEEALESLPELKDKIDLDSLRKLIYLEMCIYETLRLFPPVPVFMTRIWNPLELDNDLSLPSNTIMAVPIQAIHKNPKYFKNPEQFIPERFSDTTDNPNAYFPFCVEIRKSIGYKIDMMEIINYSAEIVRDYVISTPDKLEDIVILPSATITPAKTVKLVFQKRK